MKDDRTTFETLLKHVQTAHEAHEGLSAFCPFPDDISAQPVVPFHIKSSTLLQRETDLFTPSYGSLRDAVKNAAPHALWRETYKNTDIGSDFLERFGCYCLIGGGGAFSSAKMCAWFVYMPAHLHYTWHHHPAEESYLVLAGEADFLRKGEPTETLRAGQISQHASNQPHAMTTHDHPVLAYVIWRNGFETPPVLTPS